MRTLLSVSFFELFDCKIPEDAKICAFSSPYKYVWQYYTLLEQKAIILIFISIIDINVNLSKNEIDKKINLS